MEFPFKIGDRVAVRGNFRLVYRVEKVDSCNLKVLLRIDTIPCSYCLAYGWDDIKSYVKISF
jgi:hypothetical protein